VHVPQRRAAGHRLIERRPEPEEHDGERGQHVPMRVRVARSGGRGRRG
jgi:hypothetical protein